MPRPKKNRKICCMPRQSGFGPLGAGPHETFVPLLVEEYEAVRLMDLEGLTQEQCAEKMEVARTTVQGIYTDARKKIADALVNGKALRIEGGDYEVCEGERPACGQAHCHRRHGGGRAGGRGAGRGVRAAARGAVCTPATALEPTPATATPPTPASAPAENTPEKAE